MVKRILKLIPAKYRGGWDRTMLAVPVRSLLDLAGLAFLVPLLLLLLGGENPEAIRLLEGLYRWSGLESYATFTIILCGITLLLLVLKNILSLGLSRRQTKFLLRLYGYFSGRTFNGYYERGLPYIKSRNITDMEHEVNYVCYGFCMNVLAPLLAIFGEAVFIVLLFTALGIYAPQVALLLPLCFVPVVLVYVYSVRRKLALYGQMENRVRRNQSRLVRETLAGYPEVEVNDAFRSQKRKFEAGSSEIRKLRTRTDTLMKIPAGIMETGVAVGLVVLAVAGVGGGNSGILLGIFAVSALKLLPSVRNVTNAWALYRNNRYTVDVLEEAIPDPGTRPESNPGDISFDHTLTVRDLSFGFGQGEQILRNLNFTISKGETVGFRGPSGIGKSTLFNLLLGFYTPCEGSVELDGSPLTRSNRRGWLDMVGYVPQDVFITDGTLAENIAFGAETADIGKIRDVLALVSLDEWASSLPEGIETLLGDSGCRVSGGQKQRIGIARALYREVPVLLLDEATSAVDRETELELSAAIRAIADRGQGTTILIIAHRESSLEFCDRVIDII